MLLCEDAEMGEKSLIYVMAAFATCNETKGKSNLS